VTATGHGDKQLAAPGRVLYNPLEERPPAEGER